MLSNWKTINVLITTGIPIPNSTLNGFQNSNASIKNIYFGNSGILPYNISFNVYPSYYASLNLNNTITIKGNNGIINIMTPPYLNLIFVLIYPKNILKSSIYIPLNYTISIYKDEAIINGTPSIYIYFNGTANIIIENNTKILELSYNTNGYLEFSINGSKYYQPKYLINYNNNEVNNWLYKSKNIKNFEISNNLISDYYLSLLFIKDSQNPITGEFAASPSPIYLYNWLRDSSFAAMALQDGNHLNSSYKYWIWESNIFSGNNWYTRYNFYNGEPDISFGIPELDSIGLFQIGVYNYFQITHNYSFLTSVLPALNKTIQYEINQINNSKFHLMPEDLSVWESNMGYNFWTQSIDDIGLYYSSLIYQYLGINNSLIKYYENLLNESIIKYFWNGKYFYPTLNKAVLYINNTQEIILSPAYSRFDSSTILPLSLGFISPESNTAYSDVNQEIAHLTVLGGLSRFIGDDYHYSQSLYDSSAPNPPWIITTLFLAYYYEQINNITGAINLLNWAYNHSQNGLLPEAIDPNYGNPLPTTSPLTWSASMYIIDILNLPQNTSNKLDEIISWIIIIVLLIAIWYVMRNRSILNK
ncbi:glycosyl hydrolase, glucoamylase [Caldisphaera lagunensis DSM 15908]|uniref:Glycosyl hydrolase, glucoamylase n=1 Tax=Caldisphaera lagunensis (strain DSM 15908 / JCM 11604 / ANMR 0165 / IC-154) TaxID=1056495 RepID=L0A991_CALLD|nr:glycosyl hydrolase [Caldisphaera lagunensis]AFZ70468.1 glycosyl hydrolase, glucoamylase [Caldisphaera lagunensis DSM 15908]